MLDLCLLGCGGGMPTPERFLTSMVFSHNGRKLLIDCGEGTQVSLKIYKLGFKSIDIILFTHFHADHIAGLPGMLLTIAGSGRKDPITIMGPSGLYDIIKGLMVIAPNLTYELKLIEFNAEEKYSQKIGDFNIRALPVDHGIPCVAYSIYIPRNKKFDRQMAEKNNVPIKLWNTLQKGENCKYQNVVYTPDMVLGKDRRGIKVSYCTDSRPTSDLIQFVKNSNLFVCEGTYGDEEKFQKAVEYKHMLFRESAEIAKQANVEELWLTHFSPSMINPEEYLQKTRDIFPNIVLGQNGLKKSFGFEKRN